MTDTKPTIGADSPGAGGDVLTHLDIKRMRRHQLRKRFFERKLAIVGLIASVGLVLLAVFAPWIAPFDPTKVDFEATFQAPSWDHWFGTDSLGRDYLSRVIFGARAAMQVGVGAVVLGFVIAVPIGLISGYFRGWTDAIIMRATDALLAFPFVILTIGFAVIFGPKLFIALIAIGISIVPRLVRVVRGEALSLREEEYVAAAVAGGARHRTILFRHILPNMRNTLLVQATVLIPVTIIIESTISFLGLGVQPPQPSWGVMLARAQTELSASAYLAIFPGLAIAAATISFNLFGDGLRDVLDPKDYR
jgi:peptide/nickel transport system permease protein